MKKAEVTTASTDVLILELARMVTSSRILKSDQKTANWICKELESRNVVDDAASLYERWDRLYTW